MRPPRIVILALFFAACLFLLCRAITSTLAPAAPTIVTTPAAPEKSRFKSLFSLSAPFALFLPNAVITIAADNTTSFAARPAGFGPQLPNKGLNGQLWIGSGFTEETLQDDVGEGELGCSDVPGWNDLGTNVVLKTASIKEGQDKVGSIKPPSSKTNRRKKRDDISKEAAAALKQVTKSQKVPVNDGTDDYLHVGLDLSPKLQTDASGLVSSGHADIQSIQEGAEIAGKIVLLSRGGCGFLEKVKWAQRRGAAALVVGDNVRGGPLIQMYAHGDTSNITIPSVFTSRTTAYLLSLMMQPGSYIEDFIDENGKPTQKVQQTEKKKARQQHQAAAKVQKPRQAVANKANTATTKDAGSSTTDGSAAPAADNRSWFSRVFSWRSAASTGGTSRPPSSGQHDWVLVEDFSDEKDKIIRDSMEKAAKGSSPSGSKTTPEQKQGDGFRIGVHDWRDPDLLPDLRDQDTSSHGSPKTGEKANQVDAASKQDVKKSKKHDGPQGGSITPGSGEYATKDEPSTKSKSGETQDNTSKGGFFWRLFGGRTGAHRVELPPSPTNTPIVKVAQPTQTAIHPPPGDHEGLWIVITPTNGASPLLDTLLVLVISPLITLTVVYALLILRARIRRRRWRAPKSVVERLPVRTYHTVASTPSHSPRIPTTPSPPSPTTPLLQSQHGPSRSRPRSRTTTGVAGDLLQANSALQLPGSSPSHEKPSEWKKYMGRQVECVVCLEEYVDGVSQVMSLPCGHEFHVECITPWLTTRRRTCPICKGDVVRSLARGSPSSPLYEPYRDDSDDDFSLQASSSSSSHASSHLPIRSDDADVERGILSPAPRGSRDSARPDGWLGMLSHSFRSMSSRPRSAGPSEDRNR
ncbi:Pa domain-containing protein [Apiospora marii]|uniref:RING-type E3 ubiquitin transferase n=1 Tax=Apiospora marii TaxID=335849 RepID=A0ABR1SSP4_9PEZI